MKKNSLEKQSLKLYNPDAAKPLAHSFNDPTLNRQLLLNLLPVLQALRLYHRHEIVGVENLPSQGGALIACNHSLATYDITLLVAGIYLQTGRLTRALTDRLFFKIPFLDQLMIQIGCFEGTREHARALLERGNFVCVAPGGMKEALRSSQEKYTIQWDRRLGFARMAMETQSPLILAACPGADDIYDVSRSTITNLVYQWFRVPVFFAKGLAFTPLPKPAKLTHYLSEPLYPPKLSKSEKKFESSLLAFHKDIVETMQALMKKSIQ